MTAVESLPFEDAALLRGLTPDVRRLVVAGCTSVRYGFGEVIVRQGEPSDALYLLQSGRARVVATGADSVEVTLRVLAAGDSFGADGLLRETTRSATVRASSVVEAVRLDGAVFRALARTHPEVAEQVELALRRHLLGDFLTLRSEFADLPAEELDALLRGLTPRSVPAGGAVIRQGEPAGPLYFVTDGRLRVSRDGRDTGFLGPGEHFGERSLFTGVPRSASVHAVSATELLCLSPETFRALLASSPQFRDQIARRVAQYDYRDRARVADDVTQELLPADAAPPPAVGADEVEVTRDGFAESGSDAPPGGPFATGDGRFVKRSGRNRTVPLVWQVDEADCGAACLTMIARHHGRKVGLARVRELARTGVEGTTLSGLAAGAAALGLAARRVKASRRNLDQMPLPAIAHWDANHWVVVEDVAARTVRVADPALGHRRFSRREFDERWSGYAALFEPSHEGADQPAGVGVGWMWTLLRPYRARMLLAVLLAFAVAALQMAVPGVLQIAVDRVVPSRDYGLLGLLVAGLAGLIAAVLAGSVAQRYLLAWVAVRMDSQAMAEVSSRLLDLPMSYFYARRTGDIQRRFAGMQQIRRIVVGNGVVAITSVTQLVAGLVFMLLLSPTMAALFWATVPVHVALTRYANARLRPLTDSLEEAYGRYYSRQVDAVRGIETVKAAAAEDLLRDQLVGEFDGLTRRAFKVDLGTMLYEGATRLITLVSLALFVWVGVLQVLAGRLSIGELVAFNALIGLANAPILSLLGMYDQLQFVSVLLGRLSDVFQAEPEQGTDHTALAPVPALAGRVRLVDVGFGYGPDAPRILEHLNLDVPAGATVAVVGRSGSGKTTLAKLLAGLIEPTAGAITYDGVEMTGLDYRQLRRHIGVVLQESYVFADTITANIAFGTGEPDPARVRWAAKVANAHKFVARLPLGYETKIGETGLLLSGGQRQRIAIARAVYHRPAVLILDEATSALDTESERAVQENMDRLLAGRTCFVIAHRLSTVRHADLIVVLEKGRIVEQGTHDELMDREGLYFYLTGQQLQL